MHYKPLLSKADAVALSIVALLFVMMLPVFGQATDRARELSRRTTCAANIKGIMNSMVLYAHDQTNSSYPALPPPKSATTYDVAFEPAEGLKGADDTVTSLYTKPKYTDNPSAMLWLLVLSEGMAPKLTICQSDTFGNVPARAFHSDTNNVEGKENGNYYLNFQSANNFSYSTAYPWRLDKNGKVINNGFWKDTTDASLPIVSDMAPYLGAKSEPTTRPAGSDPKKELDADWAVTKANSQNHQFEGQNVGFADCHVDFSRHPAVGQNNESIWGIRKGADDEPTKKEDLKGITEVPIEAGTLPHAPKGVADFYDVIMVPTRDAKGDLK